MGACCAKAGQKLGKEAQNQYKNNLRVSDVGGGLELNPFNTGLVNFFALRMNVWLFIPMVIVNSFPFIVLLVQTILEATEMIQTKSSLGASTYNDSQSYALLNLNNISLVVGVYAFMSAFFGKNIFGQVIGRIANLCIIAGVGIIGMGFNIWVIVIASGRLNHCDTHSLNAFCKNERTDLIAVLCLTIPYLFVHLTDMVVAFVIMFYLPAQLRAAGWSSANIDKYTNASTDSATRAEIVEAEKGMILANKNYTPLQGGKGYMN